MKGYRSVGLVLLFAIALSGCQDMSRLLGRNNPMIRHDHAEQVFELAGEFLEEQDSQQLVYLYCQVSEFSGCYRAEGERLLAWDGSSYNPEIENLDNVIDRELGRAIVSEVGIDRILHAQRSGVKVRCERSIETPDQIACWIDYGHGNGWETLPVV